MCRYRTLGSGRVNGLRFETQDILWVATEGGLSRIAGGHISTLTSRNGLPCNTVHWSAEDDEHSVWLYTSCGIVRISRSELDAWRVDPGKSIRTTLFDISDGVRIHTYPLEPHSWLKPRTEESGSQRSMV